MFMYIDWVGGPSGGGTGLGALNPRTKIQLPRMRSSAPVCRPCAPGGAVYVGRTLQPGVEGDGEERPGERQGGLSAPETIHAPPP